MPRRKSPPPEPEPDSPRTELVFLGEDIDPHRVCFWRVVASADGLTLTPGYEPDGATGVATWHELHDLLQVRPALLAEIEELHGEIRQLAAERDRIMIRGRTLKHALASRQARLDAMPDPDRATEDGPGILRLKRRPEPYEPATT